MKTTFFNIIFIVSCSNIAMGQETLETPKNKKKGKNAQEEFYTPNQDRRGMHAKAKYVEGRKNVLIIGDSISIGYTPSVMTELEETYNIFRIPANAGNTDRGLKTIDKWLGDRKWDLIHFNWGLHDLCYRNPKSKVHGKRDKKTGTLDVPINQYKTNLEKLVVRLKKTNAKLIWASTTVVPEGEAGRFVGDDLKYNAVAKKIMDKHEIVINDLHAHSATITETFSGPGNVHFTKEGSASLGKKVSEAIQAQLKE